MTALDNAQTLSSAFQQAVLKSVNDKSAQVQKQLDSVIREANSELAVLNDKIRGLERDLELERRKNREQHEQLRERDKEYARLKSQYDQLKRKALLAPEALSAAATETANEGMNTRQDEPSRPRQVAPGLAGFASLSVNDVVNNMEVGGLQRTPLRAYANNTTSGWQAPGHATLSKSGRAQVAAQGSHRFQMENATAGLSTSLQPPRGANGIGNATGGGLRPRRAGSDGRPPDSPRGSENSGEIDRKMAGRNQADVAVGVGSSRLQQGQANRPAQRDFSFGQTIQRGTSIPLLLLLGLTPPQRHLLAWPTNSVNLVHSDRLAFRGE